MRPAYFLLAWLFFALGALGMVVPGLPTVPFMLLALWAFSKSSKRFHCWLYTHRVFGPSLQQWQAHRVIPLKAKIVSLLSMALSMAYMTLYVNMPTWLLLATATLMAYGAWFVLSHPSKPPA
ncbi:MAG: YbaN family protein, partial [Thiobacillus sp.]|nr:YbaN family protein [Thiobacillus sp.]